MKKYIVFKIRSNLSSKRDYLQTHAYVGGMPVRLDAEEAHRLVENIETRHREGKDTEYRISTAFVVLVGEKSDWEVFEFAQQLASAQLQGSGAYGGCYRKEGSE